MDANHNILGNPDLKPENSHHLQANLVWIQPFDEVHKLRVEPSLFYNQLNDMINLTQVQGTYFTYLNIDQYTTFGGKIQVGYLPVFMWLVKLVAPIAIAIVFLNGLGILKF